MSNFTIDTNIARGAGTPPRLGLLIGGGLAVVLVLFFVIRAFRPAPIPAPTAFLPYTAPDKSFVCESPGGWGRDEAGVEGSQAAGVVFKQGSARIDIDSDETSGVMTDIINATNAQQQQAREDMMSTPGIPQNLPIPPPPVPAVEQLHTRAASGFAARYGDYHEQPIHAFQSGLGDARLSEWTGTESMGRHLHGYRVTMIGRDKCIRLNCRCPEADWKTLQPAFVRVIRSVAPGPG